MIDAFISYSHKDTKSLERLHTHLAVLNREGKIRQWFDQKILAGGEIDHEISSHLQNCKLYIALVSPDFLASHYCFEKEMQVAINLYAADKLRIVPIILEHCDWKNTVLRRFKALPQDGTPIADYPNPNIPLNEIVTEIRRLISVPISTTQKHADIPSKPKEKYQYLIKKKFDQIDKSDFCQNCYITIRDFIKLQIEQIGHLEQIRSRFSDINAQGFTCTVLNKVRSNSIGHLTLYAMSNAILGDLFYSYSENAPPNTSNGNFRIEANDFKLYLKKGFSMFGDNQAEITTQEAAEILWKELLQRANIELA